MRPVALYSAWLLWSTRVRFAIPAWADVIRRVSYPKFNIIFKTCSSCKQGVPNLTLATVLSILNSKVRKCADGAHS
jgi:hypothetical protein